MTNTDFIRKINNQFGHRGKGGFVLAYSEFQENEISLWAERRLHSDTARDNLYNDVLNKFKYAPSIKELNDLLDAAAPLTNQSYVPANGIGMDSKTIYAEIADIRSRQFNDEKLSNRDIDFIATWHMIEYYWEVMTEAGKNPILVCERARTLIERGEKVPAIETLGKANIEAYILTAFRDKIINDDRRKSA